MTSLSNGESGSSVRTKLNTGLIVTDRYFYKSETLLIAGSDVFADGEVLIIGAVTYTATGTGGHVTNSAGQKFIKTNGAAAYLSTTDGESAQDKFDQVAMTLEQQGAVGDGVTNDKTALSAALTLSASRGMHIRSGVYKIQMGGIAALTTKADTVISGNLSATMTFAADTSGTTKFLDLSGAFSSYNVNYTATHSISGGTLQFIVADNNMTFFGNKFNGGVTDNAGAPSHIAHVFEFSSNDTDKFLSVGNEYKAVTRVILKTNTSLKTNTNLKFIGDSFVDNTGETLAINSPGGTARDILFLGNTVENNIGDDVGASAHTFGGANVQGVRAIGNYHYGKGDEIFHLEEGAAWWAAIGNTAYFTNARAGIFLTDNNVGGGGYIPIDFGAAIGNTLIRATRAGGIAGIDVASDGAGTQPLRYSVLSNNVVSGWERGVRLAESPMLNLVNSNVLTDSDEGLQVLRPSLMTHDNLLIDNTQSIDIQTSGVLGHQYFATEGAWDGTSVLIDKPTVVAGQEAGLSGWTAEFEAATLANGTQNYLIIPLGTVMSGDLWVVASKTSTVRRMVHIRPTWDGTTFTQNLVLSYGSSISFVDFRNDGSGNLAIRLATGAAISGVRFQVTFRGMQLFT